MRNNKVVAVIPAHNEEATIGSVVRDCLQYVASVIVVDDGSTDRTYFEAANAGAICIPYQNNHGYGHAVWMGLLSASEGYPVAVTLDGDGQHDPYEIPKVVEPILQDKADIVIGSRFLSKGVRIPAYRRLGIKVIDTAFNLFNRVQTTDSQSGFRAYRLRAINSLHATEKGFGFITEILLRAIKAGWIIREVPVSCTYHNLTQDSHMNPVTHGFGVLSHTLMWRVRLWV